MKHHKNMRHIAMVIISVVIIISFYIIITDYRNNHKIEEGFQVKDVIGKVRKTIKSNIPKAKSGFVSLKDYTTNLSKRTINVSKNTYKYLKSFLPF